MAIEKIADVIEELSKVSFDETSEVSTHFEIARVNQGGLRFIGKGEHENKLAQEYLSYASYYSKSHLNTSKALKGISNYYKGIVIDDIRRNEDD